MEIGGRLRIMPKEMKRLAHDVTNLLQGVIGYLELAENDNVHAMTYYDKAVTCARDAVEVLDREWDSYGRGGNGLNGNCKEGPRRPQRSFFISD